MLGIKRLLFPMARWWAHLLRVSLWHVDLFAPLLIMTPLCLALLPGGIPNTADSPVHLMRAAEMIQAWQEGLFIPRWAADLGNGYGLPLFVYAPPLPYYLMSLLHTVGLSLELAFKGTLLLAIAIACFGAYQMNRTLLGQWPAIVGAAAYLYAPILLRELFIQGNIAQLLAWVFVPWACYGIIQLFRTAQLRNGLIVALAVMGTMLSHNAAALLMAGTVASLSIILWVCTHQWRALLATVASSLLGLALSAWFWAPALLEGKYVQLGRIVASDFRPRFISLAELIALSPRLDTGAINSFFPLTLGAVQVWLALIGLLFLCSLSLVWLSKHQRVDRLLSATGLFFSLFTLFCALMATAWSEPIWRVLPFLNLFEWPFRWHGFTVVGLSWLCAFAIFAMLRTLARWPTPLGANIVGALALLLFIGSALVNLYPKLLPLGTFKSAPADVVRFETRSSAIGTTSLGEFNPIWVNNPLADLPTPDHYRRHRPANRLPNKLPPGVRATVELASTHTHQFRLDLPTPITLTLDLLYFPGWQATVDGTPISVVPHPGNGLLDVSLPAGLHTLRVHFGETPLRAFADLISLVAWLGLGLWIALRVVRKVLQRRDAEPQRRKELGRERPVQPGRQALATLALCIGLLLGVARLLPDWFQLHSQADQALTAPIQLKVNFDDKLRLLGADPAPVVAAPGASVTVVTYWRALQRLPDNYGIFLHLDTPSGETIATVDQSHPSDIPTSSWSPNLYVRVPLRLTIPANALPIRYQLRVGIVDAEGKHWLAFTNQLPGGSDHGDAFPIGQLWVEPAVPAHVAT
ncbi:MAG: 6-pyruvoyl-tetrahydropterin synthase-related protein, partial [Chloroflexi bacterium]|nr:6-pyruvoyl-tetrahydropterin synthase-related protein [Chloroflexota bacterium]